MDMIVAKVANVVNRERQFPLKLHSERVASDTTINDCVVNFSQLAKLFEQDIANVEKLDTPLASAMREVFDLVKDTFNEFHTHFLQRESAASKHFEEYKTILAEQYGAVMTLELGKIHNNLTVWRQNFLNHQMHNTAAVQNTVSVQNQMNNHLTAELKKNFNDLKLRHGLVVAEKKNAEQKVLQLEAAQLKAASGNFQGAAACQKEIQEWMCKVKELEATIKFKDEQFLRDEAMVKHAQDACARAEDNYNKLNKDYELLKKSKEENEKLQAANQELESKCQTYAAMKVESEEIKASCEDLNKNFDKQIKAGEEQVKLAQQETDDALKQARDAQKKASDAEKMAADLDAKNKCLSEDAAMHNKIIAELQDKVGKAKGYAEILDVLKVSSVDEAQQLVTKILNIEQKDVKLQASNMDLRLNNRINSQENLAIKKELNVDKAQHATQIKKQDNQLATEKAQHSAQVQKMEKQHQEVVAALEKKHQKESDFLKNKVQAHELEKSAAVELAESHLCDLEAGKKKIDTLAAENARLSFQVTIDRAHFGAERKASKRTIEDRKMDIERLEADVHRLASKLNAATTGASTKNPFADPSPQAVATLKAQAEQPDNLVLRAAPFDYKVVPNPSSPNTALHAAERRIASLEEYNKMLSLLLEEGVKHRKAPHVRAVLIEKGLYAAKPYRSYVNADYWREVTELGERLQGVPEEVVVKLLAAPALFEQGGEMIVDSDECF